MTDKIVYTTCQYNECKKPLGQESKDLGYPTCHEHRSCASCDLPLAPVEIQWCVDKYKEKLEKDPSESFELIHPRCYSLKKPSLAQDPTLSIKQSEYDYLNLCRLMIEPSMELSAVTNENNAMISANKYVQTLVHNLDFDAAYMHLKKLEACVTEVGLFVAKQDKKELKRRADEREKANEKKAKQEAKTSSRPVQKPADDEHEVLLAAFMARNEIKSRVVGQKLWSDRNKAINGWLKAGIAKNVAEEMVDKGIDYSRKAKDMGDK